MNCISADFSTKYSTTWNYFFLNIVSLVTNKDWGNGQILTNCHDIQMLIRDPCTTPPTAILLIHYRPKYGISREHIGNIQFWYFDLLKMSWRHSQTSTVTLMQLSYVVLRTKTYNVQNERYTIEFKGMCRLRNTHTNIFPIHLHLHSYFM